MWQLGGLSLSSGSETAAGASGDNSPSLHHLLECEQRGMNGLEKALGVTALGAVSSWQGRARRAQVGKWIQQRESLAQGIPWDRSSSCASAVSSSLFVCFPRNSQVGFPKKQKAELGMLGDCNRYLKNLKFKLGVDSSWCYLKAEGFLPGP